MRTSTATTTPISTRTAVPPTGPFARIALASMSAGALAGAITPSSC